MKQRFNKFLLLTFLFILLLVNVSFSMETQTPSNLNIRELRVGEKMPDITLVSAGDVVYNATDKTRFSEFKNKLIILDFWNTRCGACIAAFPKMEKLQRQFKDSIQIILVNAEQTQKEITQSLKYLKTDPLPYDLPQLVNARLLGQLFPYEYSGNQIWIDGNGIVQLNGSLLNNHAEKIRRVLGGLPITYVKQGKRNTPEKDLPPLATLYNKEIKFSPLQQSLILPYNEEFGSAAGGFKKGIVDTVLNTLTYRYVNVDLLSLYNEALFKDFIQSWKNEIFRPYEIGYLNKYILNVGDTLRYTDQFFLEHRDGDWRRSQYCYEQIVPADLPDNQRRQYMLQDLDRYFGNLYGTEVRIETQYPICYVLIKTPSFRLDQLKAKNTEDGGLILRFQKNGSKMIHWRNYKLSSLMQSYAAILFRRNRQPFLDETACGELLDIILPDPAVIKNVDELKKALQLYGLDIEEAPRKMNMVVVKDKSLSKSK